MTASLLLAGCGKMGVAMLAGWLDDKYAASDIMVVEPFEKTARKLRKKYGVFTVSNPNVLPSAFLPDVIVFAVKPQIMDDVAPGYAKFAETGCVYLSIAAGKTIEYFEAKLGSNAAIVRSMPNTPAAVGRGMTVACGNPNVSATQSALCGSLLAAVGEVAWVEDEGLLDPVTAVSGSGPAYIFLLAECLTEAGIKAGLPQALAEQLARTTIAGSGELLSQSTETADTLRINVTSPGGTTAAALEVLMAENGMHSLFDQAILAATRRSRELASS
jgi:pyrroline-5-carboxylate reductase